jgi:low temperature requirement protein LtrA
MAVLMISALWWTYFPYAKPSCEHAIAKRHGNARSRMARDVYSVIHFPMLCGIIAVAVALEVSLAHPDEPMAASVRAALGVGTLLFVGGTAVAVWRSTGRVLLSRWALGAAAAVLAVLVPGAPWVSLLLMFLILSAVVMTERSRFA